MNLRFIDWIWNVQGSLPLSAQTSSEEAFDRLAPLFRQVGTNYERFQNQLRFAKKDPAAQDKMAVFEQGLLQVEQGEAGPVLTYHMRSRALLLCFLAPLLFLAFGQLTIFAGQMEKAPVTAKAPEKPKAALPMHPIDQWLGAPAPEKPDAKKKESAAEKKAKKFSPTAAYVFAGIFAALYLIGRFLEPWLVRRLFLRQLALEV
ncbi:hypothetical protein EOE18_16645 [Novosphingobium umbonatum]|uniref:Uncharacterized protein n=1 Tax=Novosphingobium umbonatum TaxID=1908524 RepID=A0A437MZZ7_9SPHN|nr:hypothetical protein [Novosphingobium umbonatum]RVU03243.1 hypothetical protein EOE18_16645 [Novosphingobium umbonatum]